ncbi:MAG: hypothetical protein Q8L97_10060 [Nitrosomonas sp.]|nr:hypothetical protein [Nitrosomonas sp.]
MSFSLSSKGIFLTPLLRLLFGVLASGAFSPPAVGADGYFCAVDHSVGFSFNKTIKEWNPSIFKTTEKLLIARSSEEDIKLGFAWVVKEIGSSSPSYVCDTGFNDAGFLHCQGVIGSVLGSFTFNKRNNRFLATYMAGYVTDGIGLGDLFEEGSNTPYMKIGKCSPL